MNWVDSTPVTDELDQQGIPYRLFTHTGMVRSLEQAAVERGQRPEQVIRSLLFRLPGEQYVMVLVAGPGQIPWKNLRRYLGESRLTTADPEELLAVTGYQRGAVSPFGLKRPVRILVDRQIVSQTDISLGSGVRGTTVILKTADLQKGLPNAEIVDLYGQE